MTFREEEHPRGGRGSKEGGRFVKKGTSSTHESSKGKSEPEAKSKRPSGERIRALLSRLGQKMEEAELRDDWIRYRKLSDMRDRLKRMNPSESLAISSTATPAAETKSSRKTSPVQPEEIPKTTPFNQRDAAKFLKHAHESGRQITVYHVVGSKWKNGDPLRTWDQLMQAGLVTKKDWKWDEAPVGFDGDLVSVHVSLEHALWHNREFGNTQSRILEVTVPEDAHLIVNEEGFLTIQNGVSAENLKVLKFPAHGSSH